MRGTCDVPPSSLRRTVPVYARSWPRRRFVRRTGGCFGVLGALTLVALAPGDGYPGEPPQGALVIPVRVVYTDGAQTQDAEIGLKWRGPQGRQWASHKTDATGHVDVRVRDPGRYLVCVVGAPGVDGHWLHRDVYTSATHVDVGYEARSKELTLVAPRPGNLRVELDRGALPPRKEGYGWNEIVVRRYFSDDVLS